MLLWFHNALWDFDSPSLLLAKYYVWQKTAEVCPLSPRPPWGPTSPQLSFLPDIPIDSVRENCLQAAQHSSGSSIGLFVFLFVLAEDILLTP